MRCKARPIVYGAVWLVIAILLAEAQDADTLGWIPGLALDLAPPIAMFLVGSIARSIVAGAVVGAGLEYLLQDRTLGDANIILYAGLLLVLLLRAARGGAYDSVVEYVSFPGRFRISPILAAASSAALAHWLGLNVVGSSTYYPSVALIALIASRQPRPLTAAVIASLAGLGPLWAPAVALYSAFAPLPPLSCGMVSIGLLAGVEAETSPGRALAANPGMRWKDRLIACSEGGEARVGLESPYTIIVYSREWRRIAQLLASRLTGEYVVVDVDAGLPGEEDVSKNLEVHEALTNTSRLATEGKLIVVGSCEKPVELLIDLIPPRASAIVGSCTLPQGRLFPARRGTMIALVGDTGDPVALALVLQALAPGFARQLADMIGKGVLIVTPYCGPRLALVRLPESSHE